MPTKLRKSRKQRGSRTCGWGRVGQHRDQGAKPYRKVGRHKHKWSYVVKYDPEYFGKKGFTSIRKLKQKVKTINISELEEVAGKVAVEKEDKLFVDLDKLGYTKLLGGGKISKPLTVKVATCSEKASQKIKDAGGEILTEAEEKGE